MNTGRRINYPAARRPVADEMRCRHVTRRGERAGLRCGAVALFWPVGGNSCRYHGGDGPAYRDHYWAEAEKLMRREGTTWGVFLPESVRAQMVRICLDHEQSWQRRAARRLQRAHGWSDAELSAGDSGTNMRLSGRAAIRADLIAKFPYLAEQRHGDALEDYIDQRIEQHRAQRSSTGSNGSPHVGRSRTYASPHRGDYEKLLAEPGEPAKPSKQPPILPGSFVQDLSSEPTDAPDDDLFDPDVWC